MPTQQRSIRLYFFFSSLLLNFSLRLHVLYSVVIYAYANIALTRALSLSDHILLHQDLVAWLGRRRDLLQVLLDVFFCLTILDNASVIWSIVVYFASLAALVVLLTL